LEPPTKKLDFEWIYRAPDPREPIFPQPPEQPGTAPSNSGWTPFNPDGKAIHLHANPVELLADWFFYATYRYADVDAPYSTWAGAANSGNDGGRGAPQNKNNMSLEGALAFLLVLRN